MTQTSLFSYPPNPWPKGSQKHRIYDRLTKYGRVKNIEILFGLGGPRIMNTTGRCSSIRKFLAPHGIKLHCERIHDGVFEYRLGAGN